MNHLNNIPLGPAVIWEEQWQSFGPLQVRRTTLGQTTALFNSAQNGGRLITLVATEEQGWRYWTYQDTLLPLLALAAVPGGVYPLEIYGQQFTVQFRHPAPGQGDPPALELRPLNGRPLPAPEDYCLGTIRLISL